jgi:hypothetical protein
VGLDSHSNGKEKRWKLFAAAKFPKAAAQGGVGDADRFDHFEPNSVKPIISSPIREEENRFLEKSSEMVKTVSGQEQWVGDDL